MGYCSFVYNSASILKMAEAIEPGSSNSGKSGYLMSARRVKGKADTIAALFNAFIMIVVSEIGKLASAG